MLHLRFHRRAPSNPTSPVADRSSWDTAALQPAQLVPDDGIPAPETRPRSSNAAPYVLTHAHGHPPSQPSTQVPTQAQPQSHSPLDPMPPVLPPITRIASGDSVLSMSLGKLDLGEPKPPSRSPLVEQSGFVGGLALHNLQREQAAVHSQAPPQRGSATMPTTSASDSPISGVSPSDHGKPVPPVKSAKANSSFVSPTDLQGAPATGRRSGGGGKLRPDPPALPNSVPPEPPKTKKGLPFLKNPMTTLLMRRKTGQTAPDSALPLLKQPEKVYDPRIKGTRVHDFSAPRPKKTVSQPANAPSSEAQNDTSSNMDEAPPVPPKDDHVRPSRDSSSFRAQDPSAFASYVGGAPESKESTRTRKHSIALSRITMSRSGSGASGKSTFSAIPRHMKSTSSRFSFDMNGANRQEKVLEERHRQRYQGMAGTESTDHDTRFDEFDEDSFDCDGMDYDDGLEEKIPGVNADLDEEDDFEAANDPDNDQDNFAGFVFQRSDPASALITPLSAGAIPTPRDVAGHVLSNAGAGETAEDERYLGQSIDNPDRQFAGETHLDVIAAGLGIPGLGYGAVVGETDAQRLPKPSNAGERAPLGKDDELYFDDGLGHDFDGEGDGSTFDESIFDLNDTDQYGRPIPGLFANALAQRIGEKKRESDMTSRLSAQSAVSQSTGHTSLSVDMRRNLPDASEVLDTPLTKTQGNSDVAYQAALAAAAHQAAASGKFRRDSPSPPPADLMAASPTRFGSSDSHTDSHSHPHSHSDFLHENLDDYEEDDVFTARLEEYEIDDESIIAEANASALANDYDGWYGQEFGFYSAPIPQPGPHSGSRTDSNLYQYSNGGFFGPTGVIRSTSGRVVSREPNLTPITERSEYSNRNSVMSMVWSQAQGLNGGSSAMQSPELAQLMMTDDFDISLAGLMKLRNKAWGGSQASLVSSRDGSSPYDRNGATSPLSQEAPGMSIAGRKNSAFSLYSQDSTGAESMANSPTLTMAIPPNLPPSASNIPLNMVSSANLSPVPLVNPQLGGCTVGFPPLSEVEEPSSPERKLT
ncbi:hypothetical protein F5Y17DRAFT_10845 [Xylariaceae sp. FL0594]|nr:hypothetical protein F5Y17DRAFT_10845 [Xylariaceae sp. FL0594]